MARPNSEHADKNWINSVCRSWAEWATSAASSAKRRSRTVIFFTVDFAFRRVIRRPSDLVCGLTPTVDEQKARFNTIEKKIPKRVGAITHPCTGYPPLLIVNDSKTLPSYWTVAFVLVWKDFTMLNRLGGQPIVISIANSPSLITRSKALVRLMKAIYKGTFCSLHFSCSCRIPKIMSVAER